MDYKTQQIDLQQKSAKLASAHCCAPPHAAMSMRLRSASVDTPIYEPLKNHTLSELAENPSVRQHIDESTGEIINYELKKGSYQLASTQYDNRLRSQIKKHALLDTASRLLWIKKDKDTQHEQHKTCKCHKVSYVPDNNFIGLKKDEYDSGQISGLIKCGKFWTCPVCATVIAETKGSELRDMMIKAESEGYKIELWNFTVPHYLDQKFSLNLETMKNALEDFWRSGTIRRYKKMASELSPKARIKKFGCGYVGRVSCLEVTYSEKNGFHPHFHVLVISKQNSKTNDWHGDLLNEWQNSLIKNGIEPRSKSGWNNFHRALVIQDGSKAGEYITKFGTDRDTKLTKDGKSLSWDMADEMSRTHAKKGRGLSYTPFDLLELIRFGDIDKAKKKKFKAVFREYAETVQSKKLAHCRWSKGLRDYFDIEPELTDEEIVNSRDKNAVTVGLATKTEFAELTKHALVTREPTISILKNLVEKNVSDTNEHDVIPRFIYERTSQTINYTQYLIEYYQRFLPDAEPTDSKFKVDENISSRTDEQIFIDEIASYDTHLSRLDVGSIQWKAIVKVRNSLAKQLELLQEINSRL